MLKVFKSFLILNSGFLALGLVLWQIAVKLFDNLCFFGLPIKICDVIKMIEHLN